MLHSAWWCGHPPIEVGGRNRSGLIRISGRARRLKVLLSTNAATSRRQLTIDEPTFSQAGGCGYFVPTKAAVGSSPPARMKGVIDCNKSKVEVDNTRAILCTVRCGPQHLTAQATKPHIPAFQERSCASATCRRAAFSLWRGHGKIYRRAPRVGRLCPFK